MRVYYLHSSAFLSDLCRYRSGLIPSNHLWGWVELKAKGHCLQSCSRRWNERAELGSWGWLIRQIFWVLCQQSRADVFVSIDARSAWIVLCLRALGLVSVPLVHLERALSLPRLSRGWHGWVASRLWREAERFHSISSSGTLLFCEAYRMERTRCHFLAMAADASFFKGCKDVEEERICLLIGNKGTANLDPIFEAMPLGETLVAVVAAGEAVSLRGHRCFGSGMELREDVPPEEMHRLIRRSRVLLFPPVRDADGGNVELFLESLSCGKIAILVGDCGLADYARAGVNCIVIPGGAIACLRESIQEVLSNPQQFAGIRKQALRSAREEFSREKFGDALEASIERAALDKRSRAMEKHPIQKEEAMN